MLWSTVAYIRNIYWIPLSDLILNLRLDLRFVFLQNRFSPFIDIFNFDNILKYLRPQNHLFRINQKLPSTLYQNIRDHQRRLDICTFNTLKNTIIREDKLNNLINSRSSQSEKLERQMEEFWEALALSLEIADFFYLVYLVR